MSSHGRRGKRTPWDLPYKGTNTTHEGSALKASLLPEVLMPSHWRLSFNVTISGGTQTYTLQQKVMGPSLKVVSEGRMKDEHSEP